MAKAPPHPQQLGAKKILDGGLFGMFPRHLEVFLGIDQSYTGFGVTAVSGEDYFTWCYVGQGTGIDRLIDIERFLILVLDTLRNESMVVCDAAMEGYAFSAQRAHQAGELGAIVKRTLYCSTLYPLIVAPTQLKKFATGKGTGVSKAEILLAVYKHWGVEFRDDNMADSFVLAQIAAGYDKYAYQTEILKKVAATRESTE